VLAWQESEPNPGGEGGLIRITVAVNFGDEDDGTGPLPSGGPVATAASPAIAAGPLPSGGPPITATAPAAAGWRVYPSVVGPYRYTASEPAILSIALDRRGRIILAVAASAAECDILVSEDRGRHFSRRTLTGSGQSSVAPRIMVRSDGGCLLFVTRGQGQSLSLYYARSDDALSWSPFRPFVDEPALRLNFLPTHAALGSSDIVVFQSYLTTGNSVPSFQLFLKQSHDGGLSWTESRRLTSFSDPLAGPGEDPLRFDNQRPFLSLLGDRLFLVWERRHNNGSPQVYGGELDAQGLFTAPPQRINQEEAYCNNPVALSYGNSPVVAWFDNRRGTNRVYLARHDGLRWIDYDLSGPADDLAFVRPALSKAGISLFYQARSQGTGRIHGIFPDQSVPAPALTALNFSPGLRRRGERIRLTWDEPQDPAGIAGYSWLWTQDEGEEPARTLGEGASPLPPVLDLNAAEDGIWYFSLIARDQAGNWSAPARISYIRDTTPPPAAGIIPPRTDGTGFLQSNTFRLTWVPPPASDISGYVWNLEYLGPPELLGDLEGEDLARSAAARFPRIPPLNSSRPAPVLSASYRNQDDGLWRFALAAVDQAGNIAPPSQHFFRTNKYIPYTAVSLVDAAQDEQGSLSVRLLGRGFSRDGRVWRIILDRDGIPPYDREYHLARGDYQVSSDREITGLRIEDIDQGQYRLGVEHPVRGLSFAAAPVTVHRTGTVKFGDYRDTWQPSWKIRDRRPLVPVETLIIAAVLILCFAGVLAVLRGIARTLLDSRAARTEVSALFTGDFMPMEKKQRLAALRRQGLGLRFKLASFTIVLVLLVVVMVSFPLYYMMISSQERTLLRGLWDRSRVLLEGLATSARAYLPGKNTLELGFLPDQIAAIPEARYVTITGYGDGDTVFDDHVWATNDPDILSKIDTAEFRPGLSRIQDLISPRLDPIGAELNRAAREQAGDLSRAISELTREGLEIATSADPESQRRFADIQVSTLSLETRLAEHLAEIGREIGSEPAFSTDRPDWRGSRRHIFFKPVLYRQGQEDVYFRGLIRLEVTLDSIHAQITQDRMELLRIILLVALAALVMGTVGALVLSSLIIGPLRRLVAHVELIRDSEDKSKLEGLEISIKSHDEIAVLGNTINDMTRGLVKAAIAASDLSIGKEVQKKFIPLETDRDGNKLSAGYKETAAAEFFGYYEGAKGVSGDYFDYQDLDGRYYAIIKCDVAGKGIPAALIMIQVATMFLNHFKQWKPGDQGMRIQELVYHINDFIETLGFKGRFAAFTLCLFDSHTGLLRFCNAGDNIVHFFDASEGRMKTLTLPETPATGVLPNFMVRAKGGYTVNTVTLDRDDILFLYTDGIEEAKRRFRDPEFREIVCTQGDAPAGSPHENHSVGQGDEELGARRVEDIINAVMNRRTYTLHKWHNPEGPAAALSFDFSACRGTVEEAVMALVAVEKMFRCYKSPRMGADNQVLVDKKLDTFLKTHFLQYRTYCSRTRENPGSEAYMYYTGLDEDEQYDDLTILGIRRKSP
jgi:serine phosphatase RsbU (regulator of sigma subunit)